MGGRGVTFLGVAAGLLLAGGAGLPWWVVWVALTLVTADAAVRLLVSHLTGQAARWTDWIGAALLFGAVVWPGLNQVFIVAGITWLTMRVTFAWRDAILYLPAR
jgi:hypothetical protein